MKHTMVDPAEFARIVELDVRCERRLQRPRRRDRFFVVVPRSRRLADWLRRVAVAVLVCTFVPCAARAADAPTAGQIYSMAMSAMAKAALPEKITYRIGYVNHHISLSVTCDRATHRLMETTLGIGNDQKSNTGTAHYDSRTGLGWIVTPSGKTVLECAPFPFAPTVSAFSQKPAPKAPAAPDARLDLMKVIASVRAFYPGAYDIRNAGLESENGHSVYHLQFTARDRDQRSHPMTDALIDANSYLVRSVTLGGGKRGFFEGGGGTAVFTFGSASGYWVVKSIAISASGHMLFLSERGSLVYTFDDFSFSR